MIVCIHEDRLEYLVGLKLTLLSIINCCQSLPIIVSSPNSPVTFRSWVKALPNVQLLEEPTLKGLGWNVKPTLLLYCLEQGYSDVIWIDSDIIIGRDFRQRFSKIGYKTLVVAPEYYWGPRQGGNHRAIAWGLKPGKNLPATVNTGIVKVTSHHIELLKAWQILLKHPVYIEAQRQPTENRPLAMVSDQEVLTALLGSEDFSHIPIDFLERGVEIAQCFKAAGYTPVERLKSIWSGSPMFIHAMGGKPWRRAFYLAIAQTQNKSLGDRLRTNYDSLHLELSPYMTVARQYQNQLDEATDWIKTDSVLARFLAMLFLGHPCLQELPLSLLEAAARRLRRMLNSDRHKYQSNICLKSSTLNESSQQ